MNSLEIVKLIFVLLFLLPPVVLSRGNHVGIYEHHRHPTLRPQALKRVQFIFAEFLKHYRRGN